jgi:hypothetical protein
MVEAGFRLRDLLQGGRRGREVRRVRAAASHTPFSSGAASPEMLKLTRRATSRSRSRKVSLSPAHGDSHRRDLHPRSPGRHRGDHRVDGEPCLRALLDFASFNVAVPRHGTPLRKRQSGSSMRVMDQAGLRWRCPHSTSRAGGDAAEAPGDLPLLACALLFGRRLTTVGSRTARLPASRRDRASRTLGWGRNHGPGEPNENRR